MKLLPVGTPVKDFSSLEISSPPQLERDEKGRIFARLPPPPANLSLNDVQSKLNAMQNDFKIMKEGGEAGHSEVTEINVAIKDMGIETSTKEKRNMIMKK